MTIIITMVKLLATMAVGFYLGKKKYLGGQTNKNLSSMIVTITSPALILSSVTSVKHGDTKLVVTLLLMGTVIYACLPFFGFLIAKALHVEKGLLGMYTLMVLFCNNSFMGFPVTQALFGDDAIFYTAILHMPFNLLFFTLGLYLIAKDAGRSRTVNKRELLNNGVIAAVLALLIYFCNISLPQVLTETLGFIGTITMPLSMLIIGASMSAYTWKEVFSEKKLYVMAAIRLGVIPVLVYGVAHLFTNNTMVINVATITFGMPIAALVAMGSAEYEKQGEIGAISVALTTILSMITIPVMAVILGI
ncbi:MAG: AEC family transporter [Lachnospiraceae bacterium]